MIVIIPAAGVGSRFSDPQLPKQYHHLNGQPVLQMTINRLLMSTIVDKVVVAIAREDKWFDSLGVSASVYSCYGGASRAESVIEALSFIQKRSMCLGDGVVAVHDAVRPLFSLSLVEELHSQAIANSGGAIAAVPVVDTVKQVELSDQQIIKSTISRDQIWLAQTPQAFQFDVLYHALYAAKADDALERITDEASAVEQFSSERPIIVSSTQRNLKITTRDDLQLAECYCSLGLV